MKDFKTIQVLVKGSVARIFFNRPRLHNAFNNTFIDEMLEAIALIKARQEIRILVLEGNGKSFCSGADVNWIKEAIHVPEEKNYAECYKLTEMFHALYSIPIPTIAKVHGVALGGGAGLVCVCDMSLATSNTFFSLSQAKAGLVPACIISYLVEKIGAAKARFYILTGRKFLAPEAKEIGLINYICAPELLDKETENLCSQILECGPYALSMAKDLIAKVPKMDVPESMEYMAKALASLRVSQEGQEGFQAFLEKKKPSWSTHV